MPQTTLYNTSRGPGSLFFNTDADGDFRRRLLGEETPASPRPHGVSLREVAFAFSSKKKKGFALDLYGARREMKDVRTYTNIEMQKKTVKIHKQDMNDKREVAS
ncbi:hypothetical protein EVAR_88348_1 [Eumeta japonica]|uniref:Uncharacterized protein n=1 Tax=Eumeta variegata TaxID=151549 RepID=A0A4C1YC34_EUMVA|nr:hypothetical protein EVAR_88348_1 [Eumeta japonica]